MTMEVGKHCSQKIDPAVMSSSSSSGPTLGETPFRKLPNFYRTTIQLSTLLDVEQPLGHNDYRTVLELLGFPPEEVRFWGCKCKRPTLEALEQWGGTVQELAAALQECERLDAISVLVQALVETLQGAHHTPGKSGSNILNQDAISASPLLQPSIVGWKEGNGSYTGPQIFSPASTQLTDAATVVSDDETSQLSLSSLQDKPSPHPVASPVITTLHSHPEARGLELGSEAAVTSLVAPRRDLDALLMSHFEIPAQIALTCFASSNGRKTTEFVCDFVASAVSRSMSHSGDLTWISNTTVYINNFARVLLLLVASLNVVTCIFGAHHTPSYILELIIAAVPVVQSLYVEQNLPVYRDFIKRIKEVEASMALITGILERGPGKSFASESSILKEFDVRKTKLSQLKSQVLPVYSDIRLCIICTLILEMFLMFSVLSIGLMCYTGQEILETLRDGFTSLALVLMCMDCAYNFALVAVYYHDRTIETVLRKDRFRLNASLVCQESDAV